MQVSKKIIEHFARAKGYYKKHDTLRGLMAMTEGLKLLCATNSLGPKKYDILNLLRELVSLYSTVDEVKEHFPGKMIYSPGQEKKLLMGLAVTLKKAHEDINSESIEEARERKIQLDKALVRAQTSLDRGNLPEAMKSFEECEQFYKDEHILFKIIGMKLLQAGHTGPSLIYLLRGIENYPEDHQAYEAAAEAYMQQKKPERATAILERGIKTLGANEELSLALALTQLKLGNLDEALKAAEDTLDLNPVNAKATAIAEKIRKRSSQ